MVVSRARFRLDSRESAGFAGVLYAEEHSHGRRVDDNTFMIGHATFDFTIRGGQLTLTPQITERQREKALADPTAFNVAGWMVAVAYPGTTWENVMCSWC